MDCDDAGLMKFFEAWIGFMVSFLSTAFAFSPFAPRSSALASLRRLGTTMSASAAIRVSRPTEEEIAKLGVKSWSTWGCGASKFPWTYGDQETAYMLQGRVTVIPDDSSLPSVTLTKGDLVVFPAGLSCTWDVHDAISKHYRFD